MSAATLSQAKGMQGGSGRRDGGAPGLSRRENLVRWLNTEAEALAGMLAVPGCKALPWGLVPVFRGVPGDKQQPTGKQLARREGYAAITAGYEGADLALMARTLAGFITPQLDRATGEWRVMRCALVETAPGSRRWEIWRTDRVSGEVAARQEVLGKTGPKVIGKR